MRLVSGSKSQVFAALLITLFWISVVWSFIPQAEAPSFNSTGWTKKREITIDNSANPSALLDYQVQVSVSYSSAMRVDFSDLRFTSNTGDEIPYWVESKADGVSALVFVRVPSIPSSSQAVISMFYGNPSAASASDGRSTFDVFDDFEYSDDPESHGWIQVYPTFGLNSYHATTDASVSRTGSRSLFTKGVDTAGTHDTDRALAKYDLPLRNNLIFEGYFFHAATTAMIERIAIQTNSNASVYTIGAVTPDGLSGRTPGVDTQYYRRYTPVEPCCGTATGIAFVPSQWNFFRLTKSSASFEGFILGQQVGPTVSDATDVSQIFIGGDSAADGPGGQPWWFDDVRVRKYANPEPSTQVGTETDVTFTVQGFYQPVDMPPTVNTVKGGSTVPLKFEVFSGTTELTDVSVVASLTAVKITCDALAPLDAIELASTGGTSLRYDSIAGQFVYNWQTPKVKQATCYRVTVSFTEGSTLSALFRLQ